LENETRYRDGRTPERDTPPRPGAVTLPYGGPWQADLGCHWRVLALEPVLVLDQRLGALEQGHAISVLDRSTGGSDGILSGQTGASGLDRRIDRALADYGDQAVAARGGAPP